MPAGKSAFHLTYSDAIGQTLDMKMPQFYGGYPLGLYYEGAPDVYGNYESEIRYIPSNEDWTGGSLVNIWSYGFDNKNGIKVAYELAIKVDGDILIYIQAGARPIHSSMITDSLRTLIADIGINATGNQYTNCLTGGAIGDTLSGLGGNDELRGRGGADLLIGGAGKDDQWGGGGADIFQFRHSDGSSEKISERDVIHDFDRMDYIDLHFIDANTSRHGNNEFSFIGSARFDGHAGELRYNGGVVKGDMDGDKHPDFSIEIENGFALHGRHFIH